MDCGLRTQLMPRRSRQAPIAVPLETIIHPSFLSNTGLRANTEVHADLKVDKIHV